MTFINTFPAKKKCFLNQLKILLVFFVIFSCQEKESLKLVENDINNRKILEYEINADSLKNGECVCYDVNSGLVISKSYWRNGVQEYINGVLYSKESKEVTPNIYTKYKTVELDNVYYHDVKVYFEGVDDVEFLEVKMYAFCRVDSTGYSFENLYATSYNDRCSGRIKVSEDLIGSFKYKEDTIRKDVKGIVELVLPCGINAYFPFESK